ncbi:MAG: Ig-like domain-containing protein, partial [Patescibacteria group bacterium]
MLAKRAFARLRKTVTFRLPILIGAVTLVTLIIAAVVSLVLQGGNGARFAQRQNVTSRSALYMSFPERMDRASVEQFLLVPQGMTGGMEWEDDVLVYRPSSPLTSGATYTFLLPAQALTAEGRALGHDIEFVFVVAGPPRVVVRIPPAGAVRISASSRITLLFDRPMVPLAAVQGEFAKDALREWPVAVTPAVEGRWRWISTVAREFIPAVPLTEGTRYTVTVPKGIASVIGDTTEEEFTWSFETLRPEVVATEPEEGSDTAGPSTVITLAFNREMDLASARGLLTLTREPSSSSAASAPRGETIGWKAVRYGETEEAVTDKRTVVLVPGAPLLFNSRYAVEGKPGIRGLEGELGTQSGFLLRFRTVGVLSVREASFRKEEGAILIRFANPIDDKTLAQGITVSPPLPKTEESPWSSQEWTENRDVRAYPDLQPSTTYTITVGTGVKDRYGQTLPEPYTFTFTTPSLRPRAFIHSRGEFGVFEKGKPPVYYLNAVNVSRLDLEFAKLSLPEFLAIRAARRKSWDFVPTLGSAELYRTWNVTPPKKKDAWSVEEFDVQEKSGQALPAGIYALLLRAPEYMQMGNERIQAVEQQYFAVTNLALTLKFSGTRALVWVTDMQTGTPVKGARVAIHALDGREAANGTSNAQGFFEADLPLPEMKADAYDWEPEFWVTAQTADDFAFVGSAWNDGIRPYNFDFPMEFRGASAKEFRLDSYVYTERPLYKAGDTVFFKGLLRLRDWDGRFTIPADRKVQVTVNDPEGKEVYREILPVSAFGSFHGKLPIDAKASLGQYSLNAALTPETDVEYPSAGGMFSVLAYRKPEYKVEVTPEREDSFTGQDVEAQVTGAYYFGAPMAGATVSWRAVATDYFFNKATDGWYSFSAEDTWCWWECERKTEPVSEGKGTLDAAGAFRITVPADLRTKALSQVFTIEADVTDANNQVVSSRGSAVVHKADVYAGVKTQDSVVAPGEGATADIITVKPDGSPLPGQSVKAALYSRQWNTVRKKNVDGAYYYDNEPKDTFLRDITVVTNEEGKGKATLTVPAGGEYRIVVTARDGEGREAKAATSVYGYSSSYVNWPRSNNDRFDVIPDKQEYKPGDTAALLLKSPYQGKGVKALVTVEREGILSKQVVDIESNAQTIRIPVTEKLIPNAYVSVVVIKPRVGETFNENPPSPAGYGRAGGLDTGAPAFKIGYAKLSVDVSGRKLAIDVQTDKQRYGPGEKVTATLRTKDAAGKPVSAEVSLGVVDMSLLALSSFETPDLTRLFYGERGLGVNTAHMLTQLLERFKPGSKGGGGGVDPESRARGTFLDTAHWTPAVVTDRNGEASFSFTLPDNLTTWQLLAIGSTKDHLFGSKAATVLETKKVIVRPVRPRFAVHGDRIGLGAIIHNYLPEKRTFRVTLAGSGFTLDGPADRVVTVASGGQVKVSFPIVADITDRMTIRLRAESEGALDDITESIPVLPFTTPQAVATAGFTEKVALEKVLPPTEREAPEGTLAVTVSPSLAAYLPKALDYLVQYPFGCAEQILSSFLPSVVLARLGEQGAVGMDQGKLRAAVTTGLQRLYTLQRGDGGFGYFAESRRSDPALSAYVLYGLALTKESGFTVDQGVIDRTASYLKDVLRRQDPAGAGDSNRGLSLNLTERAEILHALAEAGRGDVSLLNNLYDQVTGGFNRRLPLFAKAKLALAYGKTAPQSPRAADLLKEITASTRVDARGTHFEEEDAAEWGLFMNTTQRTTALVLQAFLRSDPGNALIPNVTRYLLSVRTEGHWDTTQSTVQSLLAFSQYLRQTDELNASFNGGVFINGERLLDWDVGRAQVLQRKEVTRSLDGLARGKENEVRVGVNGTGRLYYDLLLSYVFTGDRIEPAEEGISVSREARPFAHDAKGSGPKGAPFGG